MAAISQRIAIAVEGIISTDGGAELSLTGFTLERSYADWDLDLSSMDDLATPDAEKLRVDVVAHTTEQKTELSTRGTMRFLIPIDVAIRKKFGQSDQNTTTGRINISEIDSLMQFTEEMLLLLVKERTNDALDAVWEDEPKIIAAPVNEHLREMHQFTSIIRTTFRADVAIV